MRNFLVLLFLLVSVVAEGRRISEGEAADIASKYLNSATIRQTPVKAAEHSPKAHNGATNEGAPFYVFNVDKNKGFVIVSSDDRLQCILGYSDKGIFDYDNLPPQLEAFLDQYVRQLSSLPEDKPVHPSWSVSAKAESAAGGVLLETAQWGQGAPYNIKSPIIDGVQAPTGCVATAMAIIMKYHNWPDSGQKKHFYRNYLTNDTVVTDFSEFKPQWDAMLPAYKDREYTDANAASVADLMYYAGVSANMQYSSTESGAGVLGIMTALRRYFKYGSGMEEVVIQQYGDEDWEKRVRKDIDDNCPVFYYGSGSGAHAFVIDGYDNNGFFHVNWGWEGAANGYFALNNLSPGDMNFSENTGMVAGIRPACAADEIWSDLFMADDKYFNPVSPVKSINPSVENIEQNKPFDVVTPYVAFMPQLVCDLGVAIVDKDNVIKEVIKSRLVSAEKQETLSGTRLMFNGISAQCPVDETDRLQIVSRELGERNWLLVNDSKDISSSISVRNNEPYTANVTWDIDPRFGLLLYDFNRDCWASDKTIAATEANDKAGKFLVGNAYQFRPDGADANRNIYSAIKINGVWTNIVVNKVETLREYAIGVISALPGDYDIKIIGLFPGDEKSETFSIKNAGDLERYVSENECSHVTDFTLLGSGTKDDYKCIGLNMPFIAKLNLASYVPEGGELSENCFMGLPNLSKVILPENLISIGARSFLGDALETVVIPPSVKYIGSQAFQNFGNYFDRIRLSAVFCKATTPPDVDYRPFGDNTQTTLYVLPGCKAAYSEHPFWSTFKEIIEDSEPIFDTDIVIEDGIQYKVYPDYAEVIGPEKDNCPDEVVLRETVVSNGRSVPVTSIAYQAFLYSPIKKVTVPKSIVNWGTGAFSCCSDLTDVEILAPIKELPLNSFENCYSLKNITLPNTIETIGQYAISRAWGITELILPSHLKEIQWNGIIGLHNLKKIILPEDNANFILEDGVLYSKDMKWLYLYPSGDNSRERFIIPEGVTHTFDESISGENLKEVVIPSSMTVLERDFIYSTPHLESVILHDGILSIPYHCIHLPKHLTLGKNIREFGPQECFNLDPYEYNIYCLNTYLLDNFYPTDGESNIKIFSGELSPNIKFDTNYLEDYLPDDIFPKTQAYIPGKADWSSCNLQADKIHYMWKYEIDRAADKILVRPLIDGLVIDAVTINGVRNEANASGFYYYPPMDEDNLDVVVDFTVNERQAMTTHYDTDFNAEIPSEISVSSISLNTISEELIVESQIQLSATVFPENATDKTIVWSVEDENIATVDQNGLVTGVSVGKTTVYATASGLTSKCELNVNPITVTDVFLNHSTVDLLLDGNERLKATVYPPNATDKTIIWSVEDETIATVDQTGLVTALSLGATSVHATASSGVTAECEILVCPVSPTSVELNIADIELKPTETVQLIATILPEDTTDKTIFWYVDPEEEEVATVDQNGLVTAKNVGFCVVTALSCNNIGATCYILVREPSGIEAVLYDKSAFVKIFNMQGIQLYEGPYSEANLVPGYYIVVCDGKSIKIKTE